MLHAAYPNYALPTLKAVTDHVTVLYFNCFLTFMRPTPLSAGRLAVAACCIPKLCVAHAQGCHWSRHSALFQLFLNICATYTIVGWQVGWCCMLHTQIMRCPRSTLSLIKSQRFVKKILHMCVTYIISWQAGWCCIRRPCVDHVQRCHWSRHSALLTNSFSTCVRPTSLAGRLDDAAYADHVLTMLKSVTDQVTALC